ncbi:MAG: glycosyltransferase, partial [Flavobacteriales bacterium]|nr:glycosyltransferase [Flavobacteriales bacterium]
MNILVVTYWSYRDALIQTYTLPYVRLIRNRLGDSGKIYLLTIENQFHRMDEQAWKAACTKMEQENIYLIRFKYDHFGLKMAFRFFGIVSKLIRLIKKEKIAFIHSWCMTAGALGYILSVFTKKPLIIDSYEPHADSMVENGTWTRSGIKYKILSWLEKKQSRKAKTVIALTEGMKDYGSRKYGASFDHYYVKPAMVNLEKFEWNEETYQGLRKKHEVEDRVVCLYAGKLGGIYLEEEVFDFFETAYDHWKDRLKIFLLTDKNPEDVKQMMKKRNIPETIMETRFVNYNDIPPYFTLADFAINPVKPVPSKRYCTSIK